MTLPNIRFKSSHTKALELEIIDIERFHSSSSSFQHNPNQPHRVSFYHFIYISEGTGSHFIDFNQYPYQYGSFIFVNINQVHAFSLAAKTSGKLVVFSSKFFDTVLSNIRLSNDLSNFMWWGHQVLTVKGRIKHSCELLLQELDIELGINNDNEQLIQCLFSALLLQLRRVRPKFDASKVGLAAQQTINFQEFINLIEAHFQHTRDASFYAKKLNISYKTLHSLCKKATQKTPKQLIDAHTILEAKRRLVIDKTIIGQIAYDLGFTEETNFAKYFKKKTLLSPSQFRQNLFRLDIDLLITNIHLQK